MITFFAPVRPFTGLFDILQRNAILSWKVAIPGAQVIILDRDESVGRVCAELGVEWVRDVPYDERFDRPHVGGLFVAAEKRAVHDVMCFINGDNIMLDMLEAIGRVRQTFSQFCIVGERCNLTITALLDFTDPTTSAALRARMQSEGWWSNANWIDYFIYTKGAFGEVPPFVVGGGCMDNWLIQKALCSSLPLIDCGRTIIDIHQEHEERSFTATKYLTTNALSPIRSVNQALFRDHQVAAFGVPLANINTADWRMTPDGFIPQPVSSRTRIRKRLARACWHQPGLDRAARLGESATRGVRHGLGLVATAFGLASRPD
jgi:hypothetical protein